MSITKFSVAKLPYFQDSAVLFEPWAEKDWSVFLDSGYPYINQGRYDILAAEPTQTFVTVGGITEVRTKEGVNVSRENPFELLKQHLGEDSHLMEGLPFSGGVIGYFGYDLARQLEHLPEIALNAEDIPDMAVGIFDWAVIVDHQEKKSVLVVQGKDPHTIEQRSYLIDQFSQLPDRKKQIESFRVLGAVSSNMTKEEYAKAFHRVKQYLYEGDCYQVNLAQRFVVPCEGNSWAAYLELRKKNPAPFGAFLNFPQVRVLSSSPERFLKVKQGRVETKPIKGTRSRKQNFTDDQGQITELKQSKKDRAENLMIVDLLRNDISKSCKLGSVRVPKLFDLESFVTVHHLVSTVCGELEDQYHAIDLLRGCFPGGSITGAPKLRAMEIIEELEPHRRGIYCGSIGYISFNGYMDTNITIRTLVNSAKTIRFWAGGGIVSDSEMEYEYQECFDKGAALFSVLDSLKVE